jgi:2-polyprenyl-6-methoxyphenol hydroxylase-like FAD-dependent oxidoreductase
MRILISGASIAGPVLAFWLTRYGFDVTVVERAPTLRKTGGHAVDLFRPAMAISAKMGVLPRIEERASGNDRLTMYREGRPQPTDIDLDKIVGAASDRHVEIMRDDLSEIYYAAGRDDVEYLFDDSIIDIDIDGDVTFERASARTFDVIVGADGLHSNVRRLTFGDEAGLTRFLGGYLAVVSAPKTLVADQMVAHVGVGRIAAGYTAAHLDDARIVFLFRSRDELDYDHRDSLRQKALLHDAFTGMHPRVDRWLEELDRTPAFYFDAIKQLRMDRWSRRRVTLVGDAGYCPGPAVGGSTSLAVVGAYVLAGELARSGGDHLAAFAAYELAMREPVRLSRGFARAAARTIIPGSRAGVWALTRGAELVSRMPAPLSRALARLNSKGVRMHDSIHVPDYDAIDKQALTSREE